MYSTAGNIKLISIVSLSFQFLLFLSIQTILVYIEIIKFHLVVWQQESLRTHGL